MYIKERYSSSCNTLQLGSRASESFLAHTFAGMRDAFPFTTRYLLSISSPAGDVITKVDSSLAALFAILFLSAGVALTLNLLNIRIFNPPA